MQASRHTSTTCKCRQVREPRRRARCSPLWQKRGASSAAVVLSNAAHATDSPRSQPQADRMPPSCLHAIECIQVPRCRTTPIQPFPEQARSAAASTDSSRATDCAHETAAPRFPRAHDPPQSLRRLREQKRMPVRCSPDPTMSPRAPVTKWPIAFIRWRTRKRKWESAGDCGGTKPPGMHGGFDSVGSHGKCVGRNSFRPTMCRTEVRHGCWEARVAWSTHGPT